MTLRVQLVEALKRVLKAQGLTYANLAERIGMSEASVKRMFSEQSIRLERLTILSPWRAEIGMNAIEAHAEIVRSPSGDAVDAKSRSSARTRSRCRGS